MSTHDERLTPATRWGALLGMLPFLAFGAVSMIGKTHYSHQIFTGHEDLLFYLLTLVGLGAGWVRGFPLWTYSYLGWSLVFAWFWTDANTGGLVVFDTIIARGDWGWRIWVPLVLTALIALLWTRSLRPIQRAIQDCWRDWTRLSLAMYAFLAFVFLIYDENHHPYLLVFMAAATLALSAGAWFSQRSGTIRGRVLALLGGFVGAAIIGAISEATWDWRAYYGFPPASDPWYASVLRWIGFVLIFSMILFWPVIIELIQRIVRRQETV